MSSRDNIHEMLYVIGKKGNLDTFVALKIGNETDIEKYKERIKVNRKVSEIIRRNLSFWIREENF